MRQRIIVTDSQSVEQITIDSVEASVWSELDAILNDNGIALEGKTVFQADSKEAFKHANDPVLQKPVLYVYVYPAETFSGGYAI